MRPCKIRDNTDELSILEEQRGPLFLNQTFFGGYAFLLSGPQQIKTWTAAPDLATKMNEEEVKFLEIPSFNRILESSLSWQSL